MQRYTNRNILKITLPVLVSLLMEQLVGLTDTIYLGHYGDGRTELAASALAGVFYLVVFMLGFGFSVGAQVLIARRNGEGRLHEIGPVFMQGSLFLLLLAALLFALSRLCAEGLFSLLVEQQAVRRAAVDYLDWRVWGFFFSFAAAMFRALYVGTTRTRILTANSVVMVLTNVVLNYLLIFGRCGLPELGIAGAAIASVAAEAVSVLFFLLYTRLRFDWRRYRLFRFGGVDLRLLGHILSISVWVMLQEGMAFLSWFLFFVCIERLGTDQLAVTNMVRSIGSVVFLFVNAFASTASSLVSNLIGAGHAEEVRPLCRRMTRLCFSFVVPLALLIALFPERVLGFYSDDARLVAYGVPSLWVMLSTYVLCVPAFIGQFAVSGTGHTRVTLGIVLAAILFYMAYTLWLTLVLRADVALCWTTDHLYYLVTLLLSVLYLRSGRWQRGPCSAPCCGKSGAGGGAKLRPEGGGWTVG
jgi:MATE family multidrug resistance protein